MRAILLAAVLFCSFLAGCTSGNEVNAANELSGKTESRILDDEEVPIAGAGSIRGTVIDDSGLPIKGALVSLLSTSYSAQTNVNGSFGFSNVTPGTAILRVVAKDFRVHEGQVEVRADAVTEALVTLLPIEDAGPGYRQHIHDYWGSNSELLLMDKALEWSKSGPDAQTLGPAGEAVASVVRPNLSTWYMYFAIPEGQAGLPAVVLPGTKALKITITWTPANANVDAFILGYHTAGSESYKDLTPTASGVETTVQLNPDDPDNGHQLFSLWQFRIKPAPRTAPMVIVGPIQVKIMQLKGDIPVEAAHEDFWNGTTRMVLRDFNKTFNVGTNAIGSCAESAQLTPLDQGKIVPPGTNRLTMKFVWRYSNAQLSNAATDGQYALSWKPAHLPPNTPYSQYTTATPKNPAPNTLEFDIPVKIGETDAFYQKRTNWAFYPDRTDIPGPCVHNWEWGTQWNLEVVAYKDPTFI